MAGYHNAANSTSDSEGYKRSLHAAASIGYVLFLLSWSAALEKHFTAIELLLTNNRRDKSNDVKLAVMAGHDMGHYSESDEEMDDELDLDSQIDAAVDMLTAQQSAQLADQLTSELDASFTDKYQIDLLDDLESDASESDLEPDTSNLDPPNPNTPNLSLNDVNPKSEVDNDDADHVTFAINAPTISQSYLNWLGLMVVHLEAVFSISNYIIRQNFQHDVVIRILKSPLVPDQLLPWEQLIMSKHFPGDRTSKIAMTQFLRSSSIDDHGALEHIMQAVETPQCNSSIVY